MQAIFKALKIVKREDWFLQTKVYLYRGAWQVCWRLTPFPEVAGAYSKSALRSLSCSPFSGIAMAAWPSKFSLRCSQEWEPYEADMAVPMTSKDLSLKVSAPSANHRPTVLQTLGWPNRW